ncbi:MAG: MFS transporter [Gammaproteobacteria bacterium]
MFTTLTPNELETPRVSTLLPWLVCFSAALFFFYEFIQMNMINAISSDLMRDFSLNATQLNNLSSTYFWGDVALLFPAGILLDRFSVRKIIMFGMSLGILGSLIFAITHSFSIAAGAHFLAGIGNAFSFLSCMILASRWFPPQRMALVVGLIVTFAMAGGIVAQTPFTLLNSVIGWRNVLLLNAALGLMILAIIYAVVRDYPPHQEALLKQQKQKLQSYGFWASIRKTVTYPQNWLAGIYTSLLNLPIMVFGAADGILHLTQDFQLSKSNASFVVTMIFLGTIIGSPSVSWLSDRIGLRKTPMIVCAIISLALMCAIMFLPHLTYLSLIVLYLLLGIFTSAQVISYPMIAESNPKYLTGTAMGLASVLIMGGGGVSEQLFGWLLDFSAHPTLINGVPFYNHLDFTRALSMLPIAFILGLIAAFFLRETFCKASPDVENH